MRIEPRWAPCLAALVLLGTSGIGAQTKYQSGQNIAPVYEGWRRQSDGTFAMYFGYLNRNYAEVLDIPVGANNAFDAGTDRGQPTHFLPRRHRFVFQVALPREWDPQRRLIWTITANGKTEKAQGWLQPEWEIDDGVIQMNIGPGGAPPADPPNTPPRISGDAEASVTFPQTLTLSITAIDDGVPKAPPVRAGQPPRDAPSLTCRWIHYRGPGVVTFETPAASGPNTAAVRSSTRVTFSAPGVYVLHAIASDGLFETHHEVTVTVRPPAER